jgi:imidazolonepropionase-like amidohydrolase
MTSGKPFGWLAYLTFTFGALVQLGLSQPVVTIRASTVLDGKGGVQRNVRIMVRGASIVGIAPDTVAPTTYDLRGFTVMPGWIDTHVHLNGHFNSGGKADTSTESPAEFALRMEGNAWATLQGGFTTVRSVGAESDKVVRDLIRHDVIPGPRILTSGSTLNEHSGTPEEILGRML